MKCEFCINQNVSITRAKTAKGVGLEIRECPKCGAIYVTTEFDLDDVDPDITLVYEGNNKVFDENL